MGKLKIDKSNSVLLSMIGSSSDVVDTEAINEVGSGGHTIHHVHVLDCSGSMSGGKFRAAEAGIKQDRIAISKLKDGNIHTFTLYTFCSKVHKCKHFMQSPNKDLNIKFTYGMTALYDGIGASITGIKDKRNVGDKVIMKIFTDGGENSSRDFNQYQIKELIRSMEKEGFTITFVGTSGDVANVVDLLSINESNTAVHDNTAKGVEDVMNKTIIATQTYSKRLNAGKDVSRGFYKSIK